MAERPWDYLQRQWSIEATDLDWQSIRGLSANKNPYQGTQEQPVHGGAFVTLGRTFRETPNTYKD